MLNIFFLRCGLTGVRQVPFCLQRNARGRDFGRCAISGREPESGVHALGCHSLPEVKPQTSKGYRGKQTTKGKSAPRSTQERPPTLNHQEGAPVFMGAPPMILLLSLSVPSQHLCLVRQPAHPT